jgi:hypothetical protein
VINLRPDAPLPDADFQASMHKTYTDCYRMQGFVGGSWGYAVDTNDSAGLPLAEVGKGAALRERRMAVYYLGWESAEVCLFPV